MPEVRTFFKQPAKPKPKWRKPMRQVSERRMSEAESRYQVRQRVFERDGGCVLFGEPGVGPCSGRDTVHHIVKEGQGGSYDESNLLTLCWHHNTVWVEDNPAEAEARGLVKHWWEAS
jgi:hypothetical protein